MMDRKKTILDMKMHIITAQYINISFTKNNCMRFLKPNSPSIRLQDEGELEKMCHWSRSHTDTGTAAASAADAAMTGRLQTHFSSRTSQERCSCHVHYSSVTHVAQFKKIT